MPALDLSPPPRRSGVDRLRRWTVGLGLAASLACAGELPFGLWAAREVEEPAPSLRWDTAADLPVPGRLQATSGQYREIPLRWEPVLRPEVAGYVVESAGTLEGPFEERAILRDRGVLAWVDRDEPGRPLDDGSVRFYRLRSFAHDGRVSQDSSAVVVGSTASLPEPPGGLRAYSRQPRSIPLAWNAAVDPLVTGYSVERSPNPDGPFEVVAKIGGRYTTHLLDRGLGDLRVLYYRVYATHPGGERGPPSQILRAVTKPAPLPPVGLRVAERRLGSITLAWEPNVEHDLLMYRLLRWREGETPQTVTSVGALSTRAEDPAVGADEGFSYAVIAVDRDDLASRPSESVVARGIGYETVASASTGGVRLQWNPRPGEGFARARVTRRSWPWLSEAWTVEAAELLDLDVAPGRRYTYVIVLERPDGDAAPPSQPIEVEVPEAGAR